VVTALAALPLASGCERLLGGAADSITRRVPAKARVPATADEAAAHHLLSRAAFGPRPGEAHEVAREGLSRWVDRQLEPERIDDAACRLRARRFESVQLEPGNAYEFKREVLRAELSRHTLLRAVYSERQLFEVMVSCWSDHLNVDVDKGECLYFKPFDDRTVVRAHALGRFEDLIRASATSPAMLLYLDGAANVSRAPNENYARELLELHTLGVHGGYSQRDVSEAARCLTGWRVKLGGFQRGKVWFDPALHDDGAKQVLGVEVPAGLGAGDVDRLVHLVCAHPATATHLATKLARRFVSEQPPASLVERVAASFTASGGELRVVLRTLLSSPEFAASAGQKLKTPFRFVVSALRALGADTHAHAPLLEYLGRMGQGLFEFPTPDGYPQSDDAQASSLLWRWGFALSLAQGQVPTVEVPLQALEAAFVAAHGEAATQRHRWAAHLLGQPSSPELEARLARAAAASGDEGLAATVGLLLASPEFQRC
jgi:uncharacterized protein (DUF1800 family)